ncbi:DUF7344 domain-containing protein [Halobaculum marinum]|uniref:DUF7344 domain-containing protein n=1 Tax=Halobaculum marinum TaxID=3031996 RepID=A0ABD5WZK9_9EURY|nr:hypothetical protein [Halobaculum sp. DT55]
MDHVFEALGHPRRRYLLYTLETDGSRTLWGISKRIAAWEGEIPEDSVSAEATERVYVSLYHNHVPKLANDGIVAFSEAEETIEPASNAEAVLAVLDTIGGYEDSKQEDHAREKHGEGLS